MTSPFIYCVVILAFIIQTATLVVIVRDKKRTNILIYCALLMASIDLWIVLLFAQSILHYYGAGNTVLHVLQNLKYLPICFCPIAVMKITYSIVNSGKPAKKLSVLYIYPLLVQIVLWTDHYFGLFIRQYDYENTVYGPALYVHSAFAYFCLLASLFFLLYNRFVNDAVIKSQTAWLVAGVAIPTVVNGIYTLNILPVSPYATPTAFVITGFTFLFAIKHYDFLKTNPLVLRTVINQVSYFYLAIDAEMKIADFNTQAENYFPSHIFRRGENLKDLQKRHPMAFNFDEIFSSIEEAKRKGESITKEFCYVPTKMQSEKIIFSMNFTPIVQNSIYTACIITGQDITKNKETFSAMVEQERLAAAGQMITSVVQNLKVPVLRLTNCGDRMEEITQEYLAAMQKGDLSETEAKELILELKQNLLSQKTSISLINEVLNAIGEQNQRIGEDKTAFFTIKELISRMEFLLNDKLNAERCSLKITLRLDEETKVKGTLNNLVQVLVNIITNSVQAYNKKEGFVYLTLSESAGKQLLINIGDYAGGIAKEIQPKIFKQVINSKNGTGIGLYMAHATIMGNFQGKIWFSTKPGDGTEFFIEIPLCEA